MFTLLTSKVSNRAKLKVIHTVTNKLLELLDSSKSKNQTKLGRLIVDNDNGLVLIDSELEFSFYIFSWRNKEFLECYANIDKDDIRLGVSFANKVDIERLSNSQWYYEISKMKEEDKPYGIEKLMEHITEVRESNRVEKEKARVYRDYLNKTELDKAEKERREKEEKELEEVEKDLAESETF